jgi:hypothetical protein
MRILDKFKDIVMHFGNTYQNRDRNPEYFLKIRKCIIGPSI